MTWIIYISIYIYTIYWYKAWICPRKSTVLSNMFDLKSWEITQLRFYSKCISQKIKILWSQWSRQFYLAVYKTFFVTGGLFWISCIILIMLWVNNHFFMFEFIFAICYIGYLNFNQTSLIIMTNFKKEVQNFNKVTMYLSKTSGLSFFEKSRPFSISQIASLLISFYLPYVWFYF